MQVQDRFAFLLPSLAEELEQNGIPTTLEEAATWIINHMIWEDIAYLKSVPQKDMILLHHSLGQWIRNHFHLWTDNKKLLADTGMEHPDDASGVILNKVWEKLHASTTNL